MQMASRTLALLAPILLAGCGWFDSSTSLPRQSVRPGVDRQPTVNGLPPAPQRGGYDGGAAALNETRGVQVGSMVATKGGQKAQLEEKEKERMQREAERNRTRQEDRRQTAEPSGPATAPSGPATAPPGQAAVPPAQTTATTSDP